MQNNNYINYAVDIGVSQVNQKNPDSVWSGRLLLQSSEQWRNINHVYHLATLAKIFGAPKFFLLSLKKIRRHFFLAPPYRLLRCARYRLFGAPWNFFVPSNIFPPRLNLKLADVWYIFAANYHLFVNLAPPSHGAPGDAGPRQPGVRYATASE